MSPTNKSYVSIQLPLGGHSFSGRELDKVVVGGDALLRVVVDTPRCTVVPRELFDVEHPEKHLSAVGMSPCGNERVVCSVEGDMVAVIAVSDECHDMLMDRFGSRVLFTTPLFATPLPEQGTVLYLGSKTLYVRVVDGGPRLVETIEVDGDGDIIYALESIHRLYDIYNMYARAEGDVKRLMRLCKGLFRSIELCE